MSRPPTFRLGELAAAIGGLRPFEPALEKRFLQRNATALRAEARGLDLLLGVGMVGFGAYDLVNGSTQVPLALAMRLGAALVVVGILEWSRIRITPWTYRIAIWLTALTVLLVTAATMMVDGMRVEWQIAALTIVSIGFAIIQLRMREALAFLLTAGPVLLIGVQAWSGGPLDLVSAVAAVALGVAITTIAGAHIEASRRRHFLLEVATAEDARRDPLTGVLNRRAIESTLGAPGERGRGPSAVIMIDLDHFKRINDEWGHDVGDEVLRDCCRAWGELVRSGDLLGRLGGEEFFAILPNTDLDEASAVAERMRLATASVCVSGVDRQLTASFGIAEWRPDEPWREALRRADEALYRAKASGRNRVMTAA